MIVPANRTILVKGSKRSALSIALLMIGVVAMYNWILSPPVGYLRAVQRYQPIVDEAAKKTQRVGQMLEKKRQRLQSLRQELVAVQDSFFTREGARMFLGSLQSFVEQTGCKVITADFTFDGQAGQLRESKELSPVTTSHVHLTVTGQYDQIVALLERLQTNHKKIWVDSCSLKLSDMRSGRLECRLVLILHALSEKEGRTDE